MGSGGRSRVDPRSGEALIRPPWRGVAVGLTSLALVALVALSLRLHDVRDTHLDRRLADWAYLHLDGSAPHLLFLLVEIPTSLGTVGLVVVGSLLTRSWRVAVWAAATPSVAVALSELVLKPVVHRLLRVGPNSLAFPSGHATGLSCAILVLVVLVVRTRWPLVLRLALVAGLAAWLVAGCVGLVRNFLHYASDTVGAFLVSTVCVVGGALVVDAVCHRMGTSRRQLT